MDKKELGLLVIESEQTLYRISKSILKKDADCEDAAQEAVAIAFSKLHTLKNDIYAKSWLVRILIHECYRLLKKRKKFVLLGENADTDIACGRNDYSDLYTAISALEVNHRTAIALYYMEGFSVAEIAHILKIPSGTVKSRLSRAREQLKKQLTEDEEIQYEKV